MSFSGAIPSEKDIRSPAMKTDAGKEGGQMVQRLPGVQVLLGKFEPGRPEGGRL